MVYQTSEQDIAKRSSPHPGELLLEKLSRVGASVAALARATGLPEANLAVIAKGDGPMTADVALQLAGYFGDSAQYWMNHQVAFDLAVAHRAA